MSWSLIQSEGRGPGLGPEGYLSWSAHPFGDVVCRWHAQYPALAPSSPEAAVGRFCLFVSSCP